MRQLLFIFLLITVPFAPCMAMEFFKNLIDDKYPTLFHSKQLPKKVTLSTIPEEPESPGNEKDCPPPSIIQKTSSSSQEILAYKNLGRYFGCLHHVEADIFNFTAQYFPNTIDLRKLPLQGDNSQILLNGCVILRFDWLEGSLHLALSTPLGYRPLLRIDQTNADQFMTEFKKAYKLGELSAEMLPNHYELHSIQTRTTPLNFPSKSYFINNNKTDPQNPYFPYKNRKDYIPADKVNEIYNSLKQRISLTNSQE